MKTLLSIFLLVAPYLLPAAYAQKNGLSADTTLANILYKQAIDLQLNSKYDSSNVVLEKAMVLYQKHKKWKEKLECENKFARNLIYKRKFEEASDKMAQTLKESLDKLGENNIAEAGVYSNRAVIYYYEGEYDKAMEFNKKALSLQLNKLGEMHLDVANSYSKLGVLYDTKGDYEKALEYQQKALQIRLKSLGQPHPYVADSYENIGRVYYFQSDYEKAITYYQQALQLRLKLFGDVHPDLANSYNNLGNIYSNKGEYEKALEYYEKALDIFIKSFGHTHSYTAVAYNNIGDVYRYKGEYEKALEYSEKALQVRLKIHPPTHPDVASSYHNIGIVYSDKSEYEKALAYEQKALTIFIKTLGKSNLDVAKSYNNIGNIYNDKGEYNKALEYHQKALQIKIQVLGELHPDVANSYFNLGYIYSNKGEYNKALEYHQKALQIELKVLGDIHPDVASSYDNIGDVYRFKGEYNRALEYHQKALQIRIQALGELHPDVVYSYNNIGNVYQLKSEYDKALEYYQKAIPIQIKSLGEVHPTIASLYNNIGIIYSYKNDYDKALEYQQKSLQIRLKVFGEAHHEIADSYTNIAKNYIGRNDYIKALKYYHQGLQIQIKALGKFHPYVATSYNNIGATYSSTGKYKQAAEFYHQAILANISSFKDTAIYANPALLTQANSYLDGNVLLHSLRYKAQAFTNLFASSHTSKDLLAAYQTLCMADTLIEQVKNSYSAESDKVALAEKAAEVYQQAVFVCLQLQQTTQNKSYSEKAFYFAEKGKANVLTSTIAEAKAKTFAGIPDELLAQDQHLRTQITLYSQAVTDELAKGKEADSTKFARSQNKLFAFRRTQDSLISVFEKQYPQYYNLKYKTSTVTPAQIGKVLDKNTAMIEYMIADTTLHIFTLTATDFNIQTVAIDSSLTRMIRGFHNSIRFEKQNLYNDVAFKLYQLLWPKDLPANVQQLIIVPDGVLATLPFEALLMSNVPQAKNGKPTYVLEKYVISYAYSATLLHENLMRPAIKESKQLLALAPVFSNTSTNSASTATRELLMKNTTSPAFTFTAIDNDANDNLDSTANKNDNLDSTANKNDISTIERGHLLDGRYVSPLPATEEEVKGIERLFKANKGKTAVFTNGQAREEVLKSKDASFYKYLHLATHGFVNESNPELSGLILAQDSTSQEDGILYAGEIYNLQLQAELVILSACETGLGKVAKGEGIIGLTRALLYAGAKNVAVSLWKVADKSTSLLMQSFYQRLLAGDNKAKALQQAKLSMLEHNTYQQPYFWAPFILVGK